MVNKNSNFPAMPPQQIHAAARLFAVLAEPMRLRILHAIEGKSLSVNELTQLLGTRQANVSKHLKMLHEAGLLARNPTGNFVRYEIADPIVFELCHLVCDKLTRDLAKHVDLLKRLSHR